LVLLQESTVWYFAIYIQIGDIFCNT